MTKIDGKNPHVNSHGQKELDKAQKQFNEFETQVKEMTLDRMNEAPKEDIEPQTKMSQEQIRKSQDIYLKAKRTVSSKEKFNESYRADWNFAKEYVCFIAEHRELIGSTIELWTKPFAGVPAEEWEVPTNRPVWGPRYLAEKIKKCAYHRLVMNPDMDAMFRPENAVQSHGFATQYGRLVADTTIQRLDAMPVDKNRRSIFMGK